MSMIESYLMHVKKSPLWDLELFAEDWMTAKESHPYKKASLLAIIDAKLNIYEQEY